MRLIDADALLEEVKAWHERDGRTKDLRVWLKQEFLLPFMQTLQEAPTVDTEPVRHGEWKPYYEVMEVFTDVYLNTEEREVQTGWECSVCGRYSPGDPAEMPYCHCGAKMDGGKQDA